MSEPGPIVVLADLPGELQPVIEEALTAAGFTVAATSAGGAESPMVVLQTGGAGEVAAGSVATVVLTEDGPAIDEALRRGAHDVLRLPLDPRELVARVRAASRIAALQAEMRDLGGDEVGPRLLNLRQVDQHVEMVSSMARRQRTAFSVVMMDVDRTGRINDEHGRAAGDAVVAEVGRRIVAGLRGEDVAGTAGGDGFVVLLPHTPVDGAWRLADRIRASICDDPVSLGEGRDVVVTVSGGCAEGFGDDDEAHLRRAREALAEAKAAGRNRIIAAV